jgi:hypothetical protein
VLPKYLEMQLNVLDVAEQSRSVVQATSPAPIREPVDVEDPR